MERNDIAGYPIRYVNTWKNVKLNIFSAGSRIFPPKPMKLKKVTLPGVGVHHPPPPDSPMISCFVVKLGDLQYYFDFRL